MKNAYKLGAIQMLAICDHTKRQLSLKFDIVISGENSC